MYGFDLLHCFLNHKPLTKSFGLLEKNIRRKPFAFLYLYYAVFLCMLFSKINALTVETLVFY